VVRSIMSSLAKALIAIGSNCLSLARTENWVVRNPRRQELIVELGDVPRCMANSEACADFGLQLAFRHRSSLSLDIRADTLNIGVYTLIRFHRQEVPIRAPSLPSGSDSDRHFWRQTQGNRRRRPRRCRDQRHPRPRRAQTRAGRDKIAQSLTIVEISACVRNLPGINAASTIHSGDE
jgi:hypothetical protein